MNKFTRFVKSALTYMKNKIAGVATTVKEVVVEESIYIFSLFMVYVVRPFAKATLVVLDAIIATNNWFKKRLERAPAPIRWLYNNGVLLFIEKTYLSLVFGTKRKIIKAIVKWLKLTFGLTSKFAYTLVVIVLLMLPVAIWIAYDSLFKLNKEIAPDNFVAGE